MVIVSFPEKRVTRVIHCGVIEGDQKSISGMDRKLSTVSVCVCQFSFKSNIL